MPRGQNRQTPKTFWTRVDICGLAECWPWLGAVNNTGYGSVGWCGAVYCAHRVAAWLLGLVETPSAPQERSDAGHVLHTCDNRTCCNPTHWFLGSYRDNMLDMYAKGRHVVYRGAAHRNAKLTTKQVRLVRRTYDKLRSFAAVARLFGIGETSVTNIIKGRTYGLD